MIPMRRSLFAAAALAVAASLAALLQPGSGGAAATVAHWSGSASCTIAVTGTGYTHTETQHWQVSGPTTVRGAFRFVPSHWTDTGSGSSHVKQGDQTRDIVWTVKAAATGRFQFVIRASDWKLLISQANAQLRVAGGITGTQQQTVGGVAQAPGAVNLEAFETQLPPVVVGHTATRVSGAMPPTVQHGSFGPYQPGDAMVTKKCSWRFTKSA